MEHSAPRPIATWSLEKDLWTTEGIAKNPRKRKTTLLEHWGVYSETLPKQGMMRNGILYELPTLEHPTDDSASLSSHGRETLLSTPQSRDYKGLPADGYNLKNLVRDVTLLPTPAVNDMGKAYTPETWDEWVAKQKANHGNGNGHGKSLHIEALRLLRTPCAEEAGGGPLHPDTAKARNQTLRLTGQVLAATGNLSAPDGTTAYTWGEYAPAIARWEALSGRLAPPPTLPTGRGGKHQLSAVFVEWMMGLPQGWVTDTGISRNEQLKALGNGVVPQQAAEAIKRALEV